MNYKKIYDNIIESARNRKIDMYTENHHILPLCLGGNNSKTNLVELTAKEHFICHYLLTKIHKNDKIKHMKMCFALFKMKANNKYQKRYNNSFLYAKNKEVLYGENGIAKGKGSPLYGYKHSDKNKATMAEKAKKRCSKPEELKRLKDMALNRTKEHQEKINKANLGSKRTAEQRKNISLAHIGQIAWNKDKKLSKQHCEKISESNTGKKQSIEQIEKRTAKFSGEKHWTKKLNGKPNPNKGRKRTEEQIKKIKDGINKTKQLKKELQENE